MYNPSTTTQSIAASLESDAGQMSTTVLIESTRPGKHSYFYLFLLLIQALIPVIYVIIYLTPGIELLRGEIHDTFLYQSTYSSYVTMSTFYTTSKIYLSSRLTSLVTRSKVINVIYDTSDITSAYKSSQQSAISSTGTSDAVLFESSFSRSVAASTSGGMEIMNWIEFKNY